MIFTTKCTDGKVRKFQVFFTHKNILDSETDDVKCFDLVLDKLKTKTENAIESFLVN